MAFRFYRLSLSFALQIRGLPGPIGRHAQGYPNNKFNGLFTNLEHLKFRSCGGGVSFKRRRCLSTDGECPGKNRADKICNKQNCVDQNETDYRSEQCQKFNDIPYEVKTLID